MLSGSGNILHSRRSTLGGWEHLVSQHFHLQDTGRYGLRQDGLPSYIHDSEIPEALSGEAKISQHQVEALEAEKQLAHSDSESSMGGEEEEEEEEEIEKEAPQQHTKRQGDSKAARPSKKQRSQSLPSPTPLRSGESNALVLSGPEVLVKGLLSVFRLEEYTEHLIDWVPSTCTHHSQLHPPAPSLTSSSFPTPHFPPSTHHPPPPSSLCPLPPILHPPFQFHTPPPTITPPTSHACDGDTARMQSVLVCLGSTQAACAGLPWQVRRRRLLYDCIMIAYDWQVRRRRLLVDPRPPSSGQCSCKHTDAAGFHAATCKVASCFTRPLRVRVP